MLSVLSLCVFLCLFGGESRFKFWRGVVMTSSTSPKFEPLYNLFQFGIVPIVYTMPSRQGASSGQQKIVDLKLLIPCHVQGRARISTSGSLSSKASFRWNSITKNKVFLKLSN